MERRIGTRELVLMMSMVMALSAMAIDFMAPAFGDIRAHFGLGSGSTAAALIVTVFFVGEISQFVFGPVSDRFGRLPLLRAGFALYAASAVASAFAPTFGFMLGARFLWGFAAAALQVSSRAIIRDRFEGDEMARVMSLAMSIFLIVPIMAPLAGAALLAISSWQIVFAFPSVLAVVLFVWSLRLAESRPESNIVQLRLGAIGRAFGYVLSNRATARYAAGSFFLFAAFSSFLSSFERVIGEMYSRPSLFPFAFAGMSALASVLMVVNARLVTRFGTKPTAVGSTAVYLVGSLIYLAVSVGTGGLPPLYVSLGFLAVILAFNSVSGVNFGSLALQPMGEQAGVASSAYGSIQIAGAVLGSVVDRQLVDNVTPWATALAFSAILAVVLIPAPRRVSADS